MPSHRRSRRIFETRRDRGIALPISADSMDSMCIVFEGSSYVPETRTRSRSPETFTGNALEKTSARKAQFPAAEAD